MIQPTNDRHVRAAAALYESVLCDRDRAREERDRIVCSHINLSVKLIETEAERNHLACLLVNACDRNGKKLADLLHDYGATPELLEKCFESS